MEDDEFKSCLRTSVSPYLKIKVKQERERDIARWWSTCRACVEPASVSSTG